MGLANDLQQTLKIGRTVSRLHLPTCWRHCQMSLSTRNKYLVSVTQDGDKAALQTTIAWKARAMHENGNMKNLCKSISFPYLASLFSFSSFHPFAACGKFHCIIFLRIFESSFSRVC